MVCFVAVEQTKVLKRMVERKENQATTLKTYEEKAQNYIDRTPSSIEGDYKLYLDNALSHVQKEARILEIGSAVGRDADYIEKQGYSVTRSDAVNAFLEYQKKNGKQALKFNVLEDDLATRFDLVIASAVFLHFTSEQFDDAVENVKNHLNKGGYFALALKTGEGEEYTSEKMESPRYFRYWSEPALANVLRKHGFSTKTETDSTDKWLHCLAQLK